MRTCVQPFTLNDATQPGKRTIAALFLVDPNTRIISTSNIPPQQSAWHDAVSGLPSLFTHEFKELLDSKRPFPMTLAHAKKVREKLLHERKNLQKNVDNPDDFRSGWFERPCSLCEH